MFVAHFILGNKEEINVFEVRARETWGTFYFDEEDSRNLLFGRKLVRKNSMDRPFSVDLGKPQWLKDQFGKDKYGRPRYMEYFFGATKEEAINNLIEREKVYCYRMNSMPDVYESYKRRIAKLQTAYQSTSQNIRRVVA